MAVYTHFGSIEELQRTVCEEGFARLLAQMRSVRRSSDPAADLTALGWAYCEGALAEPHLYRAIFLDPASAEDRRAAADATFAELVERSPAASTRGASRRPTRSRSPRRSGARRTA